MKLKYFFLAILMSLQCNVVMADSATLPPIRAVDTVNVKQYLGRWYEIARKPMFFQRRCVQDVQANYSLTEQGTLSVENSCTTQDKQRSLANGEAYILNPPHNSQLEVSFLPKAIRWLPVGRGDYWVLKRDEQYQTALVGDPERKYLWLLARTPHISDTVWQAYLEYAKHIGYDVSDFKPTLQTEH
ncbi:lipocalin family protein [Acinetobacter sp. B5B]|uniref:lipocalin family protein n=1 Tax=Acinetobacter baretiae TaxID=2605383 RepID=UPI0018C2CD8A|nr:lipocalin family protein [Acinetobacter baretiae]MBF7682433.1 lipocalin family protein [Acinetobacter baretiae]